MSITRTIIVLALAFAQSGCDETATPADSGSSGDGGDASGGDAGELMVAAPQIPWLPEGAPPVTLPSWDECAPGWRRVVEDDGASYCEPFAPEGPESCGAGEAHFMGGAGCEPVGGACPSGPFADGLPASAVYVDPSAPGGGDGSASSPHTSLADVPWSSLAPMTTVALAKGTFDGPIYMRDGTTVVGACARETILTGAASDATIAISGSGSAVLRDVTISGAPGGAVFAWGGHDLTLEGVIIEHVTGHALLVQNGGAVTLSRVVIRDGELPDAGAFPRGITVALGGHITLSHVIFERLLGAAIHAQDEGTTVTAEDVVVRDMETEPGTGEFGAAVLSTGGPSVEIRRALFEGCRKVAALATQPDTSISVEAVIVRDMVLPTIGSVLSNVFVADMGAHIVADDVVVERHFEYAAVASKEGSRIEISDAVLRGGRTSRTGRDGRGVGAQLGGSASVARVIVEDFTGTGVYLADPMTTAVVEDLVVRRAADTGSGSGIQISNGAAMTLTRARVEGVRNAGILTAFEGASLTLTDVAVRGVGPLLDMTLFGHGIEVQNDGLITGRRVIVEDTRESGMGGLGTGAQLDLEDVVVRDVLPSLNNGRHGQGISVSNGARATLRRARIERTHEVALAALAGDLEATDVTVSVVSLDGCREGMCASSGDDRMAIGAMAAIAGELSLERFVVERSAVCGVLIASDGQLDLVDGLVSDSAIGACMQVDGYPLERIMSGVTYRDNASNLDSTSLPVPAAVDGVPEE